MGHETDVIAFFAELAEAPHRFDFYQTLRRLECLYADKPRWGRALRPVEEPVRLGQEPELSFAPAPLAGFVPPADGRPARLNVRLFGLLGPNGPMPLFFTEYVRDRLRNANDPTLSRFLDVFHHRFLALFYRAWAQGQPHVSRDRPGDDRFAGYPAAFIGLLPQSHRDRDAVPDRAKLFYSGTLMRQVRNADGLAGILRGFFRVPVRIQELVGHWLGLSVTGLGSGAVLGGSVWDRQSKFRIHVGPLFYDQYESFLPGGRRLRQLVDWVRFYLCFELDWDVQLQLIEREVPRAQLGAGHRLGWTTWLGTRRTAGDAEDLCLEAEAHAGAWGAAAL